MLRFRKEAASWGATCGVLLLVLQLPHAVQPKAMVQVNLQEHRIAEHNDTAYVREIMRVAKAAEMRNYIRPEVDACDNFFEHACGNWASINPALFGSHRETNFFQLLVKAYGRKQLQLLQEGRRADDRDIDTKVKHFYAACLGIDETQLHAGYRQQLLSILSEFDYMPALVANWDDSNFDWVDVIARIQHKYGLDIILQIGPRKDFDNATLNRLFVGQPELRLASKAMYLDEDTNYHRELYQTEIKLNLVQYLRIADDLAESTAREILEFEMQLAEGLRDERSGKPFKLESRLRTVDEMQAAYAPTIDFRKFINTVLGKEFNGTYYEYMWEYQENLVRVIERTNNRQLANYIMYKLAEAFFHNEEHLEYNLETMCVVKTKELFAKVLDNMVFRRYNNRNTEGDIGTMWQNLKQTFKTQLESNQLDWIALMTRKLAIEKLDAMMLEVNSYESANFSEEYAGLNISSKNYVENVRQVYMHETRRALENLDKKPKRIEAGLLFSFTPAHITLENLIKIPVSLLQPNFLWSDAYPTALKYGTLGFLVAHELIHGFDDQGRHFDATGNDRTWWDANSTRIFDERKTCFMRQYARYRYGGKYLPESEFQAENIADNGGIRLAYRAYASWLDALDEERLQQELLPGLNYTSKQLFFISFAQFWCNDVNELFKDKVSLVDLHAPAMYRVIGSLANFNEFATAFNCAPGTTMNRDDKCEIY